MRMRMLMVAGALGAACLVSTGARAQDVKLEVQDADRLEDVLKRYVGKRVALVMQSGPELTGVVVKVGQHVVHLGELQGREFFDAAVGLDRVQAVIVRTRGR